mgnify:FL=1
MKPDGTRQTFAQALSNAARGLRYGVRCERNVRIDCCFAVLALVLAAIFRVSPEQWLAIVICIAVVVAFELVNTAVETLTDLASPQFHPLAGRAKDCAAAACLVVSACALVVGMIIFVPYVVHLFL